MFKDWLRELRNPDNKQVAGLLQYEGATCALGLFAKIHHIPMETQNEKSLAYYTIAQMLNKEGIPVKNQCDTVLDVNVVGLNDEDNLSFPEIADRLEKAYYKEVKHDAPQLQEVA